MGLFGGQQANQAPTPAWATEITQAQIGPALIGHLVQFQYQANERFDVGVVESYSSDYGGIQLNLRGGMQIVFAHQGGGPRIWIVNSA